MTTTLSPSNSHSVILTGWLQSCVLNAERIRTLPEGTEYPQFSLAITQWQQLGILLRRGSAHHVILIITVLRGCKIMTDNQKWLLNVNKPCSDFSPLIFNLNFSLREFWDVQRVLSAALINVMDITLVEIYAIRNSNVADKLSFANWLRWSKWTPMDRQPDKNDSRTICRQTSTGNKYPGNESQIG